MKKILFILSLFLILSTSCKKEKIKGCMVSTALNYNNKAEEDNGTCVYSKAVFYSRYEGYVLNGYLYQINNVELSINGNYYGNITYFYPNGVSTCYANGTITYQLINGERVYWNSKVNLINHSPISFSGSFMPYSSNECIKVSVVK